MTLTRRAHLLVGVCLGLALAHLAGALTLTDPYYRAALGLMVSATVLLVWGLRCSLREYRGEQLRAAMDRHPAGSRG